MVWVRKTELTVAAPVFVCSAVNGGTMTVLSVPSPAPSHGKSWCSNVLSIKTSVSFATPEVNGRRNLYAVPFVSGDAGGGIASVSPAILSRRFVAGVQLQTEVPLEASRRSYLVDLAQYGAYLTKARMLLPLG